MTKGQKNVR